MRTRRTVMVFAILASVVALPGAGPATAVGTCPFDGPAEHRGEVPRPREVLGFPIGRHEVTVDEAYAYLDAVDAASDRVITGTYATTVQGRPLRYAMVGLPERLEPDALEAIRQAVLAIRDPDTPADEAAALAETTPPFLYLGANVHGSEESGTDAGLHVLWDLADRSDCVAERILDRAIVVILLSQNPDGRVADTRRNAYGFDMNRDWFARTQAETDGKIELLRRYPPLLFADSHEFGYYRSFFAPNDDPVYHETPDTVIGWINDVFAPAIAREFRERDWGFFNGGGYDFFMPGYGDTVPSDGFMAAGFTLEQYNGAPMRIREEKTYVEFLLLLSIAARKSAELLVEQHAAYVDAVEQGRRGLLEPNAVFDPANELRVEVPDRRVRHYFVLDDPTRAFEVQLLIRRLQRMDVEVHRLVDPLNVPDYRPYVGEPRMRTLAAGTYWIPLAQPQKHWIHAMLNEDTYTPVGVTYDITGWSSPLLMNLDGGSSGAKVTPVATLVEPLEQPAWTLAPEAPPRLAVLELANGVYAFEGAGQLRWLLDTVWGLPYDVLSAQDVRGGALENYDVAVAASVGSNVAVNRLGDEGIAELTAWVDGGGRYVGYKYGGALLARRIGLTSATFRNSPYDVDGTLIRVNVDPASPLADGVGSNVWVMFSSDDTITADPSIVPMRYPREGAFVTSGLPTGTYRLAGQPAAVDEPYGGGRVVLFPYDVNFRGMTQGTQRILWNAIVGPDPA